VALLIALAAAGALPIGGMPRHSVSLIPAITVSAIASCALALARWTSPGGLRAGLAVGLVAILLPGVVLGWQRLSPHRSNFYNLCGRARVPEYLAAPVPIVSNNRGRSLVSWYFLPDRPARQVSHLPFWDRYDYGGVPVVETPIDRMMVESVIELAREHGEVWVVYSDLTIESLRPSYASLKVGVRDSPHVRMRHAELSTSFVLPSILAQVERVRPER
jgi:hypothetical protein